MTRCFCDRCGREDQNLYVLSAGRRPNFSLVTVEICQGCWEADVVPFLMATKVKATT